MRLVLGCLVLLAACLPARAQEGLRLHAVESGTGADATLGAVLLDLPLGTIQTVGLEEDADGTFAVTAWLTTPATADLARVTEAATGSVVAVVHRGRVLHTPRVASAVPNGLVTLPGFSETEAERLAQALRGEAATGGPDLGGPNGGGAGRAEPNQGAEDELDRLLGVESASASEFPQEDDPVSPSVADRSAVTVPASSEGADAVAQAFVTALDRRDWARAADHLHPDAQSMLRGDALASLRLDGATVRARDGLSEGAFPMASVLPDARGALDGLSDRDLAALYFGGLDALDAWGPPSPPRAVVGRAADGAVVHVLLRTDGAIEAGASAVTVVTVRPDASGAWRVLLTDARGF